MRTEMIVSEMDYLAHSILSETCECNHQHSQIFSQNLEHISMSDKAFYCKILQELNMAK